MGHVSFHGPPCLSHAGSGKTSRRADLGSARQSEPAPAALASPTHPVTFKTAMPSAAANVNVLPPRHLYHSNTTITATTTTPREAPLQDPHAAATPTTRRCRA